MNDLYKSQPNSQPQPNPQARRNQILRHASHDPGLYRQRPGAARRRQARRQSAIRGGARRREICGDSY